MEAEPTQPLVDSRSRLLASISLVVMISFVNLYPYFQSGQCFAWMLRLDGSERRAAHGMDGMGWDG